MLRKFVVTGCNGQDGRIACDMLTEMGHEVHGVARENLFNSAKYRVHNIDVRSDKFCEFLAKLKPTNILHFAALHASSERMDELKADELWKTNYYAGKRMIDLVRSSLPECSVFLAGSSQMYSTFQTIRGIDEVTPFSPTNDYARAKATLVDYGRAMRHNCSLKIQTGILFNHESRYRSESFLSKKIINTVGSASRGENIYLELRNLQALVDWSHAEDVVNAIIKINTEYPQDDFIVGSGELHTVQEFVAQAFACKGLNPWSFVSNKIKPEKTAEALQADISKLVSTGWRAKYTFEDMISSLFPEDALNDARLS